VGPLGALLALIDCICWRLRGVLWKLIGKATQSKLNLKKSKAFLLRENIMVLIYRTERKVVYEYLLENGVIVYKYVLLFLET
jgi:hypothetical protein